MESLNGTGDSLHRYVVSSGVGNSTPTVETFWRLPSSAGELTHEYDNSKGRITARLYFRYLKSKLNLIETSKFKSRMKGLEKLAKEYSEIGQVALSEECLRQFNMLVKESAIFACGFKKFITEEHVNKYRHKIKAPDGSKVQSVRLLITPIKNFTRVIPPKVVKKVKLAIDKKLFDDYVIFHLDQKAVKETVKEKIEREKDPIIFGKIAESDRYYFIDDWEDEHDDLRFEDIIEKLSLSEADITMEKTLDVSSVENLMK